jgi:hypothetical protein
MMSKRLSPNVMGFSRMSASRRFGAEWCMASSIP